MRTAEDKKNVLLYGNAAHMAISICLCFTLTTATAQMSVGDSLRRHLANLSPNDTAYVLNLLYVWMAEGKSRPESALESAQKALAISRRIGWVRGEINSLNAVALSKQRQGFYSEALTHYLPALELSEKSGNFQHISKTHNNLGILYQLNGDYPKALKHFQRVLEVENRLLDIAGVYNNMGIVFRNMQKPDSALLYYQKALDINRQLNRRHGMTATFNNIGVVLRDQGDWSGALAQYELALAGYKQMDDRESQAVVLGSIGQALTRLGRFTAARDTLEKALALAKIMGLLVTQADIAEYCEDLYALQGNYFEAYRWAKVHKALNDSLQNIQNRDELAAIRARFESDQKVALLQKDVELERSRHLLWAASALGLMLLLTASGHALRQTRRRQRIEADLQQKEIARWKAENEAQQLREEKLNEELDFRNRELNAQTLHLVQKNELLQNVSEQLRNTSKAPDPSQLRSLQRLVDSNLNDTEQWKDFKRHFEAVHPDFFGRLLAKYPTLTAHDLRYCAYLRLNLSSKEIAALLNVSLRGVETHRHRLRKKIGVGGETDLTAWAMRL